MNKLHFCIHGHFYQPPREDPFTGEIPQEYGADPYKNWTERIYHECYLPNAQEGNFQKISFNIGPTLFAWMEEHHPETVQAIIDQEHLVFQRTGLSNAMAQPYFHLILPLASERDRRTMIHWGIRDYQHRFGRDPKGMWLPETAVDLASLSSLTDQGIEFTILAPWQAKDPHLDITQPYKIDLGNERYFTVFFYNGFLSGELSFNPSASDNADKFVNDWLLTQAESMKKDNDQLFLAAMDGELFGHHQPFRDKFLGYLLDGAVEKHGIQRQFPAHWLRDFPAQQFTEILENTSWSCHHGIERWRNVCGDAPTATWKKPLREFLNGLADAIDSLYEDQLKGIINDPWKLREEYIDTLMGIKDLDTLISENIATEITPGQRTIVKLLVQAEYERLRMFSSDAWFFYDLDRIEPLNALRYAAHAASLTEQATGKDPSDGLVRIISQAHSELSGLTGDMAFLGALKKFEKLTRRDSR
jgi:alpha-amylase/alpha-mannosidase (GH57 family)